MATVTFQTIVSNNPHGIISLHFNPATGPNPFWGPKLGGSMTPNVPVDLGGVIRTFSLSAIVTISVRTTTGTFNNNSSISSTGLLSLLFNVGVTKYTVVCNVTNP